MSIRNWIYTFLNGKKIGVDEFGNRYYTGKGRKLNGRERRWVIYGEKNDERLTGLHETAKITEFFYGVSDRGASIRIPMATANAGKGYLEDRRPAANMDPYLVCAALIETTCE